MDDNTTTPTTATVDDLIAPAPWNPRLAVSGQGVTYVSLRGTRHFLPFGNPLADVVRNLPDATDTVKRAVVEGFMYAQRAAKATDDLQAFQSTARAFAEQLVDGHSGHFEMSTLNSALRDMGCEPLTTQYGVEVTYSVSFTNTFTVEAEDEDDAQDKAREAVQEWISDHLPSDAEAAYEGDWEFDINYHD
jgi:hypothetical protein